MRTLLAAGLALAAAPALAVDVVWDRDPVSQTAFASGVGDILKPWRWRRPKRETPKWQSKLDAAVLDFLETWGERRDAKTAVARYYSKLIDDEKIIGDTYELDEHIRKFRDLPFPPPAMPITNTEAAKRMEAYLAGMVEPEDPRETLRIEIPEILYPARKDDGFLSSLSEQGITPLIHEGGKFASFPVSRDDDRIEGSAIRGNFEEIQKRTSGRDFQLRGVLVLIRHGIEHVTPPYMPIFMLWADESGRHNDGDWKLWTLDGVPTQ